MECDCCCNPPAPSGKVKLVVKPDRSQQSRYGPHVHLDKTLSRTVASLPEYRCLQCFLGSPQGYDCRQLTSDDREITQKVCQELDKTFYIHCPYVANLAKPDVVKSYNAVSGILNQIRDLPGAAILHIGKMGTVEAVADRVNLLQTEGYLQSPPVLSYPLLLEIAAGQGSDLGRDFDELRHLYEGLDKTRVGICVDSQHAFASGMCDFQTHESVVKFFDEVEGICRKGVGLVHLNDSNKPFGSHVDRHAPLCQGHIWSTDATGLASLVQRCYDDGIDMITETSDGHSDMAILNKLSE